MLTRRRAGDDAAVRRRRCQDAAHERRARNQRTRVAVRDAPRRRRRLVPRGRPTWPRASLACVVLLVGLAPPPARAVSIIYGKGAIGTPDDPCANYDASKDTFELWDLPHPAHPSTYSPPASLNTTSFVVLSAARSASTTLVVVLNGNDKVQMRREEFTGTKSPRSDAPWTVEEREANRTAFMRDIFEKDVHPHRPAPLARGFKVFMSHLTEDELRRLTRPKHVLKVVLRRQDTLSQYVSNLRALDADDYTPGASKGRAPDADARVPVCVEAYDKWLARQNSWYDWCAREARDHPESWLFMSTEQLVSNPYVMTALYAHLKVPQGPMFDYRPYTADALDEKVLNYADVADLPRDLDNKW